MTDVLVSEDIRGPGMDDLAARFDVAMQPNAWRDAAKLFDALRDVRGLIVRNQTQVTADLLAAAPRLQVVGRAGVGLDNIDVVAAERAGVVVTFTPAENAISVAELAMGMMLSLSRKLCGADASTKAGGWERRAYTGGELYGKTLGLVGFGRIARLVADRAAAFGMFILAYDPYITDAPDGVTVVALDDLLSRADVISCHLPATHETSGMFNAALFGKCKLTALFINTSRGEVVDEAALIDALQQHRLAGAGLDVRADEPSPAGALNTMDNVILTPHIGAFTHEAQDRVVTRVCCDVAAVLEGRAPVSCATKITRPKRDRT